MTSWGRDVPWIETVIDVAPIVEVPVAPLVDVIAAAPTDEPPPPTFGPTDATFDDIDTQPDRKRRSRKPLVIGAVVAIALGAAVGLRMRPGDEADEAAPTSQPMIEAPVPMEIRDKAVVIEPPPPVIEERPVSKRKRATAVTTKREAPPTPVETTPPPKPKVQWDPTMLLPTDTGSGTKRK